MVSSSKTNQYHMRSISMPCRSHPSTARIEEELNKLKSWEASSPSPTAKNITNGLSRLEVLYNCMDDLLNLPKTQQALSHPESHEWANDLQDRFLRPLDVCGAARDVMAQLKEHTRDLQSALRRRKGDSSIQVSIAKYTRFRKSARKDAKKYLVVMMKQMVKKIEVTPMLEQDQHVSSLIKAIREVGLLSVYVLRLVLLFLCMPMWKPKSRRLCLVSKLLQKGAVTCENDMEENGSEMEGVDFALHKLRSGCEGAKMEIAQNRLKSLEAGIEDVEDALEYLFRRFIRVRVALLNIVSN